MCEMEGILPSILSALLLVGGASIAGSGYFGMVGGGAEDT